MLLKMTENITFTKNTSTDGRKFNSLRPQRTYDTFMGIEAWSLAFNLVILSSHQDTCIVKGETVSSCQ